MTKLEHKIDFALVFAVHNANPNGEHPCEINFVFKLRHSFVPPALSVFFV